MIDKICEHTFIKKLIKNNSIVLDLGANRGEFSKTISEKFGCKVYAVEPVPRLFELIEETAFVKKVLAAAASKSGILDIYLPEDECATTYNKKRGVNEKSIKVEAFSLGDLMRKFGINKIDLIKMDIEGEEIPILESLEPEELRKINQWTIEFHDFLYPEMYKAVEDIKRKISSSGFFCIPFSITNNGDVLFIKKGSISFLTFIYLKYFLRYLLGFIRKLKKIIKLPNF